MKTRIEPLIEWLQQNDPVAADRCLHEQGTTVGYVRQVAYGNKRPSGEKCSAIERATGVSRCALRPHDWHLVWPELAEHVQPEQASA
jgi:DNA-binding transcriptional regulator YdaS (Cro superfamily)